jgi:Transposase DDE domain
MQRGQGHGTEVCDNVQRAVDRQPKRMMAHAVTNAPGDRAWRSPMALPAKDVLGGPCEAVAAGGDDHGAEVQTCLAASIPPDVARPLTAANQQLGLFRQDAGTSEGATETSQGPAGAPLTCRVAAGEPGRPSRSDAPPAGGGGARQPQCTRSQGGRRMTRWGDAHLWEAMEQRVRRRPAGMQQRKPWVEPPCGTRKRWWEAGDFLRRGREKVRTECSWTVLAYHLRWVVNLVERPRRLAARGCDALGPSVVVRAVCLAGRAGSMARQASGGWKQRKTFSGGF